MKMEKWHEKLQINTYNPKRNGVTDNVVLSKRLSPLTNLFLNVFFNTIDRKNLIYAIPYTVLRPIPIISYLYAFRRQKSVMVFTQTSGTHVRDNPAIEHNRNYHLLNSGNYLFWNIPIGFMTEISVEAKVYLPRAVGRNKQKYIQYQKNNFLKKDKPKILLCCDENNIRISNVIEKITFGHESLENLSVGIEIGLVIFENVDRFVNSSYSSQIFLKWISPLLEKDVRLLFHFSNPLSKYIQIIKEHTDSYVLQFGPSLLRHNEQLKRASLAYFESKSIPNEEKRVEEKRFINKYNIDTPFFYTGITEIELLPLISGNIDEYYQEAKSLKSKINEEELVNKRAYYSLINLLFQLPNLSINPSKYKVSVYDPCVVGGYRHYTVPYMIEKIKESLYNEQTFNRPYLEDLISEIYCLYMELKECKRYGENDNYSRGAKDFQMLTLLNENINKEKDDTNIVLATYSPMERNILKTEVEQLGFKSDRRFDIVHIDTLSRQSFDRTNTTLILPGPLPLKYIHELFKPYRKIIMITYYGKNYELGMEQKDLVYASSQHPEDQSMRYLEEIYSDLGLQKNGLFRDYYNRKSEPKAETKVTIEEASMDKGEDPLIFRIKKLLSARNSQISKEYLQQDEETERIKQKLTELEHEDDRCSIEKANEYYKVTLKKFDDESIIVPRNLPINKSYLYLKNMDEDVQEGYPSDFKRDYYIVLMGNDARRTFLDTIIEIFDLEGSINKPLLTIWREKLRDFIDKQRLTYAQAHRKFKENGGKITYPEFLNWAKGNVIGPDDPNDLEILGKMMNDEEIIENYHLINHEVEELRNIHRRTGRTVRKIIKEILSGQLNPSELSLEEHMLYEHIHNNIYRIVDIE